MIEEHFCKLCGEKKTLEESHIIPKFVFRWLKQTGGKYIRKADNPNKRVEDGVKEYLFCRECEQLFSKLEDKFARDLFYPYSNEQVCEFKYDSDLLRFSISVLYRILLIDQINNSNLNQGFAKDLSLAQTEWSAFLLKIGELKKYNKIHIFFTTGKLTKNVLPAEGFLNYYARGIDGTIVKNSKTCIIYAKIARIIIIGEIVGFDNSEMKNTMIGLNGGKIQVKQMRLNSLLKEFLIDRVKQLNSHYNNVSEKQKAISIKYTDIHIDNTDCADIKYILDQEKTAVIDENQYDFE